MTRITDPITYNNDYKSSDLWSLEDIRLFIVQYLSQPKDFESISSHFYNKTTRDIIDFYHNFKYQIELQRHAEEVFGPNYVRKHISKKMEYINGVADRVCRRINSEVKSERTPGPIAENYKDFEEYHKEKFHQSMHRFTTQQLLDIFGKKSLSRSQRKLERIERRGISQRLDNIDELQAIEDSKIQNNREVIVVEYPTVAPLPQHSPNYFEQIEQCGAETERRIFDNFDKQDSTTDYKSNQSHSYMGAIDSQSKQFENLIQQNKICERTNKKKHETKSQPIKMEEEDDFDEEDDLFHSRYQNSYLVVSKEFPTDIPPDDESANVADSDFLPSSPRVDKSGSQTQNQEGQKHNMGISTMNSFLDSIMPKRLNEISSNLNTETKKKVTLGKEDTLKHRKADVGGISRKSMNNEDNDSMRSSSVDRHRPSSISSKAKTQVYTRDLPLSKTGSERKSMAHWIDSEKEEFKKQLSVYGKNWKKISTIITNKTEKQIRNFYQNYKKKMNLEDLLPQNERVRGKKLEPVSAGLKRTRSFNRSSSPFKKGRKKRKVISSDESAEKSQLSEIEEESKEEEKLKPKKRKETSSSPSSKVAPEPVKKSKKRTKKQISESSNSSSSSSSVDGSGDSVESSLSSHKSEDKKAHRNVPDNYDSGSDLD